MAGATTDTVTQRDLHGTIATVFRAAGWLVVVQHGQWSNPRQQSGPDFLVLRGTERRAIKGLLSGDLSAPQSKIRALYEGAGIGYTLYHPDAISQMADDAAEGFGE